MSGPRTSPTPRWRTFSLLWKAARLRAKGRQRRQAQLLHQKTGDRHDALSVLATLGLVLLTFFIHASLGWTLTSSLKITQLEHLEQTGRVMVVKSWNHTSLERLQELQTKLQEAAKSSPETLASNPSAKPSPEEIRYQSELNRIAKSIARDRKRDRGKDELQSRQQVIAHFQKHGLAGFKKDSARDFGRLSDPTSIPSFYWPFVAVMLLWWLTMMIFQGEGLELDIQRRRNPMWEWLLSHPVRPVAAFAAEMLSPLMANPLYWSAPVFWMVVLWQPFPGLTSIAASLFIGFSLAVTASCLSKALEISAMLRLSVRSRGAVMGLMSWAGYASMMLPLFILNAAPIKVWLVMSVAKLVSWFPVWPAKALILGWNAQPILWQVIFSNGILALGLITSAASLAWWATQRGLQNSNSGPPSNPRLLQANHAPSWLARNPLYLKELLWFWRDKSAVVQVILIPLTIGTFQAFNLRNVVFMAGNHWNTLCGLGILCGTYFLLVLGPRSLASEGGALWISLTWPRGLEDLLKAKARLWWLIASSLVSIILAITLWLFPADWWRILIVAGGWFLFSRSLAEKSVTLVSAPSSSGEMERAPAGRQWAAMLGTFAFGSGVLSQAWHSAIIGVVFSSLTAAAMWQNLRARLPHLFDPWSEKLPQAPTLMHAMIGIAALVEVVGIVSGIAFAAGGMSNLWLTRAFAYGIVGLIGWMIMQSFLRGRDVKSADIWLWPNAAQPVPSLLANSGAVLLGALLGGVALLYILLLSTLPLTQPYMQEIAKVSASFDKQLPWQLLLAVGFAPVAEEFFFRGLLYRALDREWGGWQAWIGSAAFFAIYHPPVSWIPVFTLGVLNAWLFKRSGRLLPCVLLHMAYNAIVILFQ